MTNDERAKMMSEIMEVVDRHIKQSEEKEQPKYINRYGKGYGISDEAMSKWKDEYKNMIISTTSILENVRRNPIDTHGLTSSFDIELQTNLLK